jgi:hypothetical protein
VTGTVRNVGGVTGTVRNVGGVTGTVRNVGGVTGTVRNVGGVTVRFRERLPLRSEVHGREDATRSFRDRHCVAI